MAESMEGPHWVVEQIWQNERLREQERRYWEAVPVVDPLIEAFHGAGLFLPEELSLGIDTARRLLELAERLTGVRDVPLGPRRA